MKLVVSLLVHEQEEVIFDQIRNFKCFVPDVSILLHISSELHRRAPGITQRLSAESGVIVNPVSLETLWADGSQAEAHIANIRYIIGSGMKIDGCIFHASNDLFVREGVIDYLKGQNAACTQREIKKISKWYWSQHVNRDKSLHFLASKLGTKPVWSEIEGSFYSTEVLAHVLKVLDDYSGTLMEKGLRRLPSFIRRRRRIRNAFKGVFYPREETLFPTLAKPFIEKRVGPYCLLKLDTNDPVTITDVDRMREGKFDSTSTVPRKFFVLKRINRQLNDPVRCYIRNIVELNSKKS
ncbi:MAG: hypothetical protein O7C75_00860 [Verrucomicrobia bacterium]|nr:hypothetical protein [Verrucomicrobiota bacterium]